MDKKGRIYIEVETEKEKIDELIKSIEKLDEKIKHLKELGISKRNLNRLFKELIKLEFEGNYLC